MGRTNTGAQYRDLEDPELLEAARTDLEAFGELVRRHQDFVFGAAMRVVKDRVTAEDIAQETFVRAHRALPDFRGDAHVRSWLYRIAGNLALNFVQRRREYPVETVPETPADRTPERAAVQRQMAAEMAEAIKALPDDQRRPLVLREYEGLSYQEIAGDMGLPLNTVRTRILRARRALRERMESWR